MIGVVDLNADVGEGVPEVDESLLKLVTSASVACGGHAGDSKTMRSTVRTALTNQVRIGAHPSYPDREGFGRTSLSIPPDDLVRSLTGQIGDLIEAAALEGGNVEYIKPHGALYHDASRSEISAALVSVAGHFTLPLMVMAGSPLEVLVPCIREGFIDRSYDEDGGLLPRSEARAILSDPAVAARQALTLAPTVDSLCVHSDTPHAREFLEAARRALQSEGYQILAE